MRVKILNFCVCVAAIFAVLFSAFLCAFLDLNPFRMDASAAAWVQAFGSVAAILVAIVIASGQSRREEKRKLESDVVTYEAIFYVLKNAKTAVSSLGVSVRQRDHLQESKTLVKSCLDFISKIDLLKLPDHRLIESIVDARTQLSLALAMADIASQNNMNHEQTNAVRAIANAHRRLEQASARILEIV